MIYDALVVGAGPAGLTFARFLAAKGFRVAVVERERELGVKPCAEGVSSATLSTAEVPRSEVGRFTVREVRRAYVFAPNGRYVPLESKGPAMGYVLDKRAFLRVLAEMAASEGAEVRVLEPAREFVRTGEGFRVRTRTMEVECRLLVGADGCTSTVASSLGLGGPRKIIPTFQYVMTNVRLEDRDATYFYLGRSVAPLGYAWIFPKDGTTANVGIGVQGANPREYLDAFIKRMGEKFSGSSIVGMGGAPLHIGGLLEKVVDDNVILIGEAAGQVIPLTGGGIHSSIAGGKVAASVAAGALESGDLSGRALSKYIELYEEPWGRRIRNSGRALRVFERVSDEDLNQLAEVIDGQDVIDLANGLDPIRVARKLLRHPVLGAKVAAKLLRG